MLRALAVATICLVTPCVASGQELSVLHIKVVLLDAQGQVTPVPHYGLLISDDPPVAAPRHYVTKADGTADVSLRPGSYMVESDRPVAFQGQAYQWTAPVKLVAGRDMVLELTAANAEVGAITADTTPFARDVEADTSLLLQPWQDSVVGIWTPTTRASGFLVDARGLIVTSQRAIGIATPIGATTSAAPAAFIEIQLTPAIKFAGRIVVADSGRDVAVLWVDPRALASVKPVPLGCDATARPPLVEGQKIFAIPREQKGLTSGEVSRVESGAAMSDFILPDGSAGGPVFAAEGAVVGLTSAVDEEDNRRREQFQIVGIKNICEVMASAERAMTGAMPPDATPLPVEPVKRLSVDALKTAVKARAGSLNPYMASSSDFDIAFITPVALYASQQQDQTAAGGSRGGTRVGNGPSAAALALTDFEGWSAYVADIPPVLLVRATPKLVEGFWTTVARGAALTQGIAVPSIKHVKSGFSRMRAFCGDREVTPIHPFRLEHRVSETETTSEGLYAFDPGALGPHCGSVKLLLYSEKEPDKGDTRAIDSKLIEQVWQDFAAFRDLQ